MSADTKLAKKMTSCCNYDNKLTDVLSNNQIMTLNISVVVVDVS